MLDVISPDADHQDDGDEPESAATPTTRAFGTRVLKYDHSRTSLESLRELEDRLIRMLSSPGEIEPVRVAPPKPDWNSYATPNSRGAMGKNGCPSPVIIIPRSRKLHLLTPPPLLPAKVFHPQEGPATAHQNQRMLRSASTPPPIG